MKRTVRKHSAKKAAKPKTSGKARRGAARTNASATSAESSDATTARAKRRALPASPKKSFPIVGIGASAGGLEAFTELLTHLPLDTGMGFVLVQHLDPTHRSALTELLAKTTKLPVREVRHDLRIEPNHVYVIPPNTSLGIADGVLKLEPRQTGAQRSIDFFFEALAHDQKECAIGVILSGTATDGTMGLEAIKGEGGITFAQDESAKYDSMPRSAVAAGCVDFVLSPEKIAQELARIAKHPLVAGAHAPVVTGGAHAPRVPIEAPRLDEKGRRTPKRPGPVGEAPTGTREARVLPEQDGYRKILHLLRHHSGVDFSLYKFATIERRIRRRMVLNKQTSLDDYAQFLRGNATEREALYSDLLINVTGFFRNPEAFEVLKQQVFPRLVSERRDETLRIWVPGCSTGQEAYSLAMAYTEFCDNARRTPKLQMFATDLNEALLEKARAGLYAKTLVADLAPERLRRFFAQEDGSYRIRKPLRDAVVFARQNILHDPPFSRLDLVACRNLLIYIEPDWQKKLLPTFHYALKPGGCLFLGASESIGPFTDLFSPVDKKHKIYFRKEGPTPAHDWGAHAPRVQVETKKPAARRKVGRGVLTAPRPAGWGQPALPSTTQPESHPGLNVQREADRVALNRYAPTGVLINADYQVLQFRGDTSAYLKQPSGHATFDVLKMAREGLMLPLRAAVNEAKKKNKAVRRENVRVQQDGQTRVVNFDVVPLKNLKERCYLIFFEGSAGVPPAGEASRQAKAERAPKGPAGGTPTGTRETRVLPRDASRRVADLERELSDTRDYLQSIQEQYEAANEELQAANEEVTSANEELQSTNEELETSKEELESTNEELTTVNEEMIRRNTDLGQLNADLVNFQGAANLTIVLLGSDLTVHRYTTRAARQFNLLPSDVGRSITGIQHNLDVPDLEEIIADVTATMQEREREVQDKSGHWYSLRVRPYLSNERKVEGAVLVLHDIDALKRSAEEITHAREYAEAIVRTARDTLLVLEADLRVHSANDAFYEAFHVTPKETEGRLIYELGNGQWDIPKLRTLLEEIIPRNSFFADYEVVHEFEHIGRRTMLLNARMLRDLNGAPRRILLGIHDITEQLESAAKLRRSELRYRLLFESARDGILILDAVTRKVTDANPFMTELLGYSREEFLGKELWEIGLLKDREESEAAVRQLQDRQIVRYENLPFKTRSGRTVEIEMIANLYREDGHEVIQCSIRDITERRQREEVLRESEDRFRMLADNMAQLAWTCDQLGNVTWYNRRWLDYTGLTFEEMKDWGWTKCHHPDHVDRVVASVQRCRESGEVWEETFPLRGMDGQYRWFLSRAVPIRDAQGNILRWFGTNTDITEQRAAEAALARLAAIVESSEDAIISIDLDGIITSWNKGAEHLFGYTAKEAIGQSVTMLIPPERLEEEPGILERVRRGESIAHLETVRRRKDGTLFDIALTVSPIRDRQGRIIGASKIGRDISHRKRNEEALRQAQAQLADRASQLERLVDERTARLRETVAELEAFSYSIAHDMRAPLRSMSSFARLVQTEHSEQLDEAAQGYLARVVSAAQRLDRLITDVLNYSGVARRALELQPVDLEKLLDEAIRNEAAFQPPLAGIEIQRPLPPVIAHEPSLMQVVNNLLLNAVKFVLPGVAPRVTVRSELVEQDVRLWFEDNGIGIAKADGERIFSLFGRLHPAGEFEGTGIGLTIVRKAVERMGGKVGVESEPGRGSRFWIQLKRSEQRE